MHTRKYLHAHAHACTSTAYSIYIYIIYIYCCFSDPAQPGQYLLEFDVPTPNTAGSPLCQWEKI